jgi:fatty-acyl-CoA synthase
MALSYVCGRGDEPLIGETIGDNLDRVAALHHGELALIARHQGVRWTYAELVGRVDECARALLALGVERGERVGIWSPNRAEWTVVQYATAKIGAILVNINPAYRAHELEYVLGQSGSSVLVAARAFKTSDYAAVIAAVRPQVTGLRRVILLDALPPTGAGADGALRPGSGQAAPSTLDAISWAEFLSGAARVSHDALRERQASLQFDDPINIQYTSGTTGFPKGATLSHHNILNNAYAVGGIQGFGPGERLCVPVPLYHCFGMVLGNLACTSRGATMVYPSDAFDPTAVLEAVQAEGCTALYGVPTMFIAELEHPQFRRYDLSSLRTGMMAGAPCPIEVMKRVVAEMHMREVTIGYGMTETSPASFLSRRDDPIERRVSTVGRVLPHIECKIVDPATGAVVPRGSSGELCTRGYSVMLGYWANEAATREAIDAARWMHTGDLAVMDDEGYVNIAGRSKDMVIRGGENVYPREVEEFLYTHPAVADVQIVGVPDAKYGEELCAWVRLHPGATLTLDELRAFCRDKIAHYKVPRYLKLTDDFPMTVTGKVQKFRMREISIAELGLEAAAAQKTA